MSAVLQVGFSIALLGLHWLLLRFLSPPRIGLLAQLAEGERGGVTLRLAVQSLQRGGPSGPFEVQVKLRGKGSFCLRPARVAAYVGTDVDYQAIEVKGSPRELVIKVASIRAMKTWVFEIECTDETRFVDAIVSGANRQLMQLVPRLGLVSEDLAGYRAGTFTFELSAERGSASRAASVESWSRLGGRLDVGDLRIPATLAAMGLLVYAGAIVGLDQLGLVRVGDPLTEALPALGLVVIIFGLHALLRPRWPVVAQGYLEAWELAVEPLEAPVATDPQ
ncbi:MAG: hypothetical protein RLP09_03755 [Sandaracinaceae bacterium]